MGLRIPPTAPPTFTRTTPRVGVGMRGGVTSSASTRLTRTTSRGGARCYYCRGVTFSSLPKFSHLKLKKYVRFFLFLRIPTVECKPQNENPKLQCDESLALIWNRGFLFQNQRLILAVFCWS